MAAVNVCIVAPSPRQVGGQATSARRLITRFSNDDRLNVTFVPSDPTLPDFLQWARRVPLLRTALNFPFFVFSLISAIRHADVVHVFSASYWSFVIATIPPVLIGKVLGKPVLLNYRSGEAADHLEHWPISRRLCASVDAVVVPSGYLVDVFARHDIAAQAIPNFVEIDELPYRHRQPLRPIFLSNRNHEELYNVSCVLRAFHRIQTEIPAARLLVAGDGSLRERLIALAQELRLNNVEFVGLVDKDAMFALYDQSDVCLNTPNIDNMPNTVLEAGACGLALVSSNVGGIPYIVAHEDTALMVAPDDPEATAHAALRLLQDQTLAHRLIANARAQIERDYSWDAVGHAWLKTYAALHRAKNSVT